MISLYRSCDATTTYNIYVYILCVLCIQVLVAAVAAYIILGDQLKFVVC